MIVNVCRQCVSCRPRVSLLIATSLFMVLKFRRVAETPSFFSRKLPVSVPLPYAPGMYIYAVFSPNAGFSGEKFRDWSSLTFSAGGVFAKETKNPGRYHILP